MKRIFSWISLLGLFFLVGCNLAVPTTSTQPPGDGGVASTPTYTDIEMQTQIALLLTAMPTSTLQPQQATATEALPTLTQPVVTVLPTNTTAPEATATSQPSPVPTETQAPVDSPTATVIAQPTTAATGGVPTVQVTPLANPTATQPPAPTFTAPAGDPRSRLGAPTSTDPMDSERAWIWPTGRDEFTAINFSNGSMALTARSEVDGWRMANPRGTEFGNLYLEGTFRTATCQGSDHYGLIARVPVIHDADKGYLFGVTCDGNYSLRRWDATIGSDGQMEWLVRWTASPAIATGSDKTNRLGLMMVGNRLILYVNGTLLTEVQDNTFTSGYFGVFVGADQTPDLTVRIDEMSYWENPQP